MIAIPQMIAGWQLNDNSDLKGLRPLNIMGAYFTNGQLGKGLFFNGIDDTARFSSSIYFNTGYSFSAKVQLSYNFRNDVQYIIGQNPDNRYHGIRWTPNRNSVSYHWGGSATFFELPFNEIIPEKWYHIVLNRISGYTYEFFVDGISLGKKNNDRNGTETMKFDNLGRITKNLTWYGGMDEIYIFNKILDTNNIERLRLGLHPIF